MTLPRDAPDDRLTWHVNGHTLTGERRAYRGWHFACDSWPALAAAHDGDATRWRWWGSS